MQEEDFYGKKIVSKSFSFGAHGFFLMGVAGVSYAATTCPSGAICRSETPGSYNTSGPYGSATFQLNGYTAGATVYYPTSTNAKAPYSSIVFMQPFTGIQSMDAAWGPFFASHGIVYVNCSSTTTMDSVDSRATQQWNAVAALKKENTRSNGKLKGKLNTSRVGIMGWSMGGGATWINASKSGVKTALSLAGHNATATSTLAKGAKTKVPMLLINGATDTTILGGRGQSEGVYNSIPSGIAKVLYVDASAGHMDWTGPKPTQAPDAGKIALAFQKTFLDGDTRWVSYIKKPSGTSTWKTANLPK